MTHVPESPARLKSLGLLLLLLLGSLGLLFSTSLNPDYVLFSNDGPLGAISCKAGEVPYAFTGYWQDLNWIGFEQPSAVANVTVGINSVLHPYLFSRFYAPITLLFAGLCAGFLFYCLRFHPIVCVLGGIAAALNMENVSYVCWGLGSRPLAMGVFLLAVAALAGGPRFRWIRILLAGFATGMGVMEGADFGAIYSLYIAAFVFYLAVTEPGSTGRRFANGFVRLGLVTICAGLLAAQAVHTLVGTQVKGVVGMEQDQKTKQDRWLEATRWSLPKIETLRLFVPGMFGYKMPELYGEATESAEGSNYWGAVGQTPGVPTDRHSGSGEHAGVVVVLLALWAVGQGWRRKNSPLTEDEQRWVKFWSVAALVSLLLSWGRHAPFYQIVYALPYFSTIRNPIKFLHPLHLSLLILFGFGLQAVCRGYLERALTVTGSMQDAVKAWWKSSQAPDRLAGRVLLAGVGLCALASLLYAASRGEMLRYLGTAGFPQPYGAKVFGFSVMEVGWSLLFLVISAATLLVAFSGALAGRRAKWLGIVLGLVLVADLSRAASPWIVYYNYKERYASNPLLDLMRKEPWERRITTPLYWRINDQFTQFQRFYHSEWLQHQFQYYNIHSLDIVQMPRPPYDRQAFVAAEAKAVAKEAKAPLRLWELTSTRWIFWPTMAVDQFNKQFDPAQQRFKILTPFTLEPYGKSHVTTTLATNGFFCLMEFTGALPRASLYTHWEVQTNLESAWNTILSPGFDPHRSVVVNTPIAPSTPPNPDAATAVTFRHYEPKKVVLDAEAKAPSVLLLNDRFADGWTVSVDGKEQPLLRCNYWMRGVQLSPGRHEVTFSFTTTNKWFHVSLAAEAVALLLCLGLVVGGRMKPNAPARSS